MRGESTLLQFCTLLFNFMEMLQSMKVNSNDLDTLCLESYIKTHLTELRNCGRIYLKIHTGA